MTRTILSFKTYSRMALLLVFLVMLASCKSVNNPVIAHRGAWKASGLPENSIASLKKAISLGCYGSEFDIHLSKDDIMVVNHDKDFMGIDIETSTYSELLVKEHTNGEKIPTVKAYLEEGLKQKKTKLILEIKKAPAGLERTLKLTEMAVDMVKSLNAQSMVEYICFSYEAGQLIKKLDPKAKVAYLNGDKTPAEAFLVGYTGIDYNFKTFLKNPHWIKEAHDLGMTVNYWTVNKEEDMRTLLDNKVDYITTNEPELLFKILNKN
ncbi:glycerophosphodiester phosphodiesterase [Gelidibacter salicanalis]|nr:glycerophosphodiester phosphodiesterase family protein [Gelidibacter salicanalis]